MISKRPDTNERVFYSYVSKSNRFQVREIKHEHYIESADHLWKKITVLPHFIPDIFIISYLYWIHLPKFTLSILKV